MGTIHDHVINFKVDLDVVNEKNSLLEKTTHVREVTHPWLDEDGYWGTTTRQQFIKSRYIETENESRLFYPPNFRGLFAFVNKEETNLWGVPRGYVIHPGYSPIYNVCIGIVWLLSLWLLYREWLIDCFVHFPFTDCRWIETYAEQCQLCKV